MLERYTCCKTMDMSCARYRPQSIRSLDDFVIIVNAMCISVLILATVLVSVTKYWSYRTGFHWIGRSENAYHI